MNEEFQLTICNVNMLVKKFLKESPVLYKRFNGRYEVESVSLLDESVKYYYCPTYNEIWQQKLSVTLINTENGTKQTCKFNGKIDQFPILIVKDNSGLGGVPYYSRDNGRSLVVLEDIEYKFVPVNVIVKLRDFQGAVVAIERLETFGDPETTGNTYVYTTKTVCVSGQYHIWIEIIVQDAEIYEKYSYTVNYMDPDTLNYVSRTYNVTTSPIDIKVPYVIDDVTVTLTATELPKTYLSLRSFGHIEVVDWKKIGIEQNWWDLSEWRQVPPPYNIPPSVYDRYEHRYMSEFNINEDEVKYVNVDIGHNVNDYSYLSVTLDTSVYDKLSCSFYQNGILSPNNIMMYSGYDTRNPIDGWYWNEEHQRVENVQPKPNVICIGYASATWQEFGDRVVSYLNPTDGDVFISQYDDYDIYIYHSNTNSWVGKKVMLGSALIYKRIVYVKKYEGPTNVPNTSRWEYYDNINFILSKTNVGYQQQKPYEHIVFYIMLNNLSSITHNLVKLQVSKITHRPTVTVNIYDYVGVVIKEYSRTTVLFKTEEGKDYDFSHIKQSAEYKLHDISGKIQLHVSNLPTDDTNAVTWFYKINNIKSDYKYIYHDTQDSDEIIITTDTTIDIFINKIVGINMLMNTNDTNLVLYDIIERPSLYPIDWNETYTTKVINGSIDRWKFRIWKGESPFTRIAPQIQIFKNSKPLERVWPEVYPTYYDFNEEGYVDIPALETYINEDREVIAITDNVDASVTGDNIEILPSIKSYVMTFTGLYKFRHKKVIFKLSYHNEQDGSFSVNDISLDDFEIQLNGMNFITPFNEPMTSSSYNNKTLSWELDMPKYQYYININMVFPNKTVINTDDDYYAEYEEPIYYNKSYFALQNGVNYNYKSYNSNEDVDYLSNSTALMDEETRTLSIKIPITRFRDSVNDDEFIEIEAVRKFVQLYNLEVYPDQNSQANVLVVKDVSIYDDNDKTEVTLPHTFTTLMEHPTSLKIELSSNEPIKCPTGHIVYTSDNNIALDAIVAYPYTLYVNNSNYKTFFSTNTANLKMTSIVRSYHIDFSMPDDGHDVIVKNHLTWEKDILLNNRSFPRKNRYFYSMYETPETTNNSIDVDVEITDNNTDNWINIIVYCSNNMDDLYDYPVIYTRAKYLTRQKHITWQVGGNIENGEQLHTTIPFEDAVWRFHFFTTDI